jgi:hypothetical protein
VPGFDGFGVQLVGKRPGQFTARFLRYAAHATVLTWTQDMQRQRSKECTITDGWPHTYTRIFIDEVVIREIIAVFPQGAMGEAYIVGRKRG